MKKILLICLALATSINYSQSASKPTSVLDNFKDQVKVRDFTIKPETNEAYYTLQSNNEEISTIVKIVKKEEEWSSREIAGFSGKYKDLEPYFSPDGLRLYFVSNRPLNDSASETKDYDIWYVERDDLSKNWSNPINPGAPINTEMDEFYPAVTETGNLYFTRPNEENNTKDDIFYSEFSKGAYLNPVALSDSINTEGYEFNSFIAPDESFLIFSGYNREDGFGSGDLYISLRSENGEWSIAKNLGGTINSDQMDYCPYVDITTNQLYFTSSRSSLENKNFKNIDEVLKQINSYENGLSRIYKADLSPIIKQAN